MCNLLVEVALNEGLILIFRMLGQVRGFFCSLKCVIFDFLCVNLSNRLTFSGTIV